MLNTATGERSEPVAISENAPATPTPRLARDAANSLSHGGFPSVELATECRGDSRKPRGRVANGVLRRDHVCGHLAEPGVTCGGWAHGRDERRGARHLRG